MAAETAFIQMSHGVADGNSEPAIQCTAAATSNHCNMTHPAQLPALPTPTTIDCPTLLRTYGCTCKRTPQASGNNSALLSTLLMHHAVHYRTALDAYNQAVRSVSRIIHIKKFADFAGEEQRVQAKADALQREIATRLEAAQSEPADSDSAAGRSRNAQRLQQLQRQLQEHQPLLSLLHTYDTALRTRTALISYLLSPDCIFPLDYFISSTGVLYRSEPHSSTHPERISYDWDMLLQRRICTSMPTSVLEQLVEMCCSHRASVRSHLRDSTVQYEWLQSCMQRLYEQYQTMDVDARDSLQQQLASNKCSEPLISQLVAKLAWLHSQNAEERISQQAARLAELRLQSATLSAPAKTADSAVDTATNSVLQSFDPVVSDTATFVQSTLSMLLQRCSCHPACQSFACLVAHFALMCVPFSTLQQWQEQLIQKLDYCHSGHSALEQLIPQTQHCIRSVYDKLLDDWLIPDLANMVMEYVAP